MKARLLTYARVLAFGYIFACNDAHFIIGESICSKK